MKAKSAQEAQHLEDIPNVGPRIAEDLRLLGFHHPMDLAGKDPLKIYEMLNRKTGVKHDPCVLDTFMAITDFMNGAKAKPWWKFTAKRKNLLKIKDS